MAIIDDVLDELKGMAAPEQLEGMARYGMTLEGRLGVTIPELRKMAKRLGRDHELAQGLWASGIVEARVLASIVDEVDRLTEAQMDAWAADFDSWDVCDQVCMNLFSKTPMAWKKVREWSLRDEEFVKRAAFALIACLAWYEKTARDEEFIALFPIIVSGATDERNYVKKGVSWALRHIGKRNPALRQAALATAANLAALDSKPAKWIAKDVVRDLNSESTLRKMQRLAAD